jgi:RimJ/RimL family protein N-acetyltransferase
MKFSIQPINQQDANDIASWQHESPYAIYNLSLQDIPVLLDSNNRYFAVKDETGRTIGYCCFSAEARVPGGEYHDSEPLVVDVGVGMHPGMVGKGLGSAFVAAILRFATEEFNPGRFRVSIAAFNKRSQKTFLKLGFVETFSFGRESDGKRFVQLERDAIWSG